MYIGNYTGTGGDTCIDNMAVVDGMVKQDIDNFEYVPAMSKS